MANSTLRQLNELSVQIETSFQINFDDTVANKEKNWFPPLRNITKSKKRTGITQKWIHDHANIKETEYGQPPTFHKMQGQSTTIDLKNFEDALRIDALDFDEDDEGLIVPRAADLGKRAALHPKDLATDILENGETATYTIFDGQPFFSNTHAKPNSVNIDNLMAGVLSSTTYQAVRTAMRRFASDLGTDDVYGITPTHTIIPPDLEITLAQILNATQLAGGPGHTDNVVLRNSSIPIMEPRLTDVNDWYVATTEFSGVMPFLQIDHIKYGQFVLHSEISDEDPAFRDHKERRWWMFAIMTVWPTRPETMIKVVN